MINPVAYIYNYANGDYALWHKTEQHIEKAIPLYTKEQLHPRVKMTKNQHKQFESYKVDKNNFYHFWQSLLVDEVSLLKEFSERELMFVWLDEELIEIVPNMKWFVRSKETNRTEYNDFLLIDSERIHGWYPFVDKKIATQFDTKEQAEQWTNPLTEAVQLPVEGE
ncbi:hypothetical protein [Leuconostoc pseudomesenteroides]